MLKDYCPKVGNVVHFAAGPPGVPAPVCLDFDPDRCAGPCPLVDGVDAVEMGHRLAMVPHGRRRLLETVAWCELCRDTLRMLLVSPDHLYCPGCQSLLDRYI